MDPIQLIFDDFCAFPHILQPFLVVFEAEKFAIVTPQNYLISRGFNNLKLGLNVLFLFGFYWILVGR